MFLKIQRRHRRMHTKNNKTYETHTNTTEPNIYRGRDARNATRRKETPPADQFCRPRPSGASFGEGDSQARIGNPLEHYAGRTKNRDNSRFPTRRPANFAAKQDNHKSGIVPPPMNLHTTRPC